ncbi:MAG: toxin-antitoxin system YwqK family antitoxin [Alphaproteobacteria bacterium]|nr:toxin-antitoxin system YwqK family antitoxin [Alphaproteobacteria bacterium]
MKRLLMYFLCCLCYAFQASAASSDSDLAITTIRQLYCNKEHGITVCTTRNFVPYTGIIKEEFNDGRLRVMAYFQNGKANGRRKEYYENGQLKEESFYKDGKMDGLFVSYYKNGLIEQEVYYKDGKIDGRWKLYNQNGMVQNEKYYYQGNETANASYTYQQ